ncbi:MAG TPA: GNAT family N-acetyltransferase [Ktedonobacterales bacterium]
MGDIPMTIMLETERLRLRRFTYDDIDALVALDSDPEVMRFLNGGVPTPRALIESEILPRFLRSYTHGDGFGVFAAIEKATGKFLGWFGFRPRKGAAAGEIELGYRLQRVAWGKGYATEGARALIRRGFTDLGVQRVMATTYQDNLPSRRVMERAGLRFVRAYRMAPEELAAEATSFVSADDLWDGDDVEYALTRSDWERQEALAQERMDSDAGVS